MRPLTPIDSMPQGRADFCRGVVLAVNMTQGGQVPLFTFRVRFEGARSSGLDATGVHDNVLMLQPGFQRPSRQDPTPGGLVYLPEEGSVVACIWDGRNWVIVGFYTGPTTTAAETAKDPEHRRAGYNPGIEAAISRIGNGSPVTLGDWGFGLTPGDVVMSKGTSKVKVNDYGVIIGGCAYSGVWFKADGEVLERFLKRTIRAPGYWRRFDSYLGPDSVLAVMASVHADGMHPPGAYACLTEVFESSPWPEALGAYLLSQRGHVSPTTMASGRAAVTSALMDQDVILERKSRKYYLINDVVVQPKSPVIAPHDVGELNTTSAVMYSFQVEADGSFRLTSGNKAQLPGAPSAATAATVPEFVFAYDSATQTFKLQAGPSAAAPLASISANGTTGVVVVTAARSASLTCQPTASTPAVAGVEVTPAGVRMFGAELKLDFASISLGKPSVVSLNHALLTGGGVIEAETVLSGAADLAHHVHPGVKGGPDLTGLPIG